MGDLTSLVRRGAVTRGVIERRIHQDDIDTIGGQTAAAKDVSGGSNVRLMTSAAIAFAAALPRARSASPSSISTKNEFDTGHAFGDRKPGGADACAQIDHAIAGARRGRRATAWRRGRRG